MKTLEIDNTIVPPVDMTYRFTWDSEPTDEQLEQLMKEVADSVRKESVKCEKQHREFLRHGFKPILYNNEG